MKTTRGAVVLAVLVFVCQNPPPVQAGLHVAIWGDHDQRLADVQSKVFASGQFDAVDVVNIYSGVVPSLADTLAYDAIMVFGGLNGWGTSTSQAAGDVLADYCDAGGGLVTATFVLGSNAGTWPIPGPVRWPRCKGNWDSTFICICTATCATTTQTCPLLRGRISRGRCPLPQTNSICGWPSPSIPS